MPIAISRAAILTPLDIPGGECTWEALMAGRRLGGNNAVADAFLDGDVALDRSLRLALAVMREVRPPRGRGGATLFCGASKGPAGVMLGALEKVRGGLRLSEAEALQVALGVGAIGPILLQRLRGEGMELTGGTTAVAACAAGLHALHRAVRALERGECESAVVVAADSSLHPLFTGSFARLGVLSQSPAEGGGGPRCTPFSEEGAGFIVSEAAAALVLTVARKEEPLAYVTGAMLAGDGSSLVAIDPGTSALRYALAKVLPERGRVAFVHAHATGTGHDVHELAAIRAVVGEEAAVFSHKHWLGHSLGAAGLVGAALSAMAHRDGRVPGGRAVAAGGASVTIAQGFGGHIAVVGMRGA